MDELVRTTSLLIQPQVVEDVPKAFAALVRSEMQAALSDGQSAAANHFRLACSGGSSGTHCYQQLARTDDLDFGRIVCYFVDERCVDETSPDANGAAIAKAFGDKRDRLGGFYPMDCETGPVAYAELLRAAGGFDLLQLGLGPDGHTASIFPDTPEVGAPGDLVAYNTDPSGNNPFNRMTLTYAGISLAKLVVFTVIGADKTDALTRLLDGEPLPPSKVEAKRVIWLCDQAAAGGLF